METQNEPTGFPTNKAWMNEETQRLFRLHQQLQEELTQLPDEVWQALERADRVLAIGSGAWVVDQAKQYHTKQFVGIESTANWVDIMRLYAGQKQVKNATFLQQDLPALASMFSQTELFSFIHMAFIAGALLDVSYPALIHTLYQLCRPGGLLVWTECELPTTSSENFTALVACICKSLDTIGHRYEPPHLSEQHLLAHEWTIKREERGQLGIVAYLSSWLRRTGFVGVQLVPHAIDISSYAPAHTVFVEQLEVVLKWVGPFLLGQKVISVSEFDTLVAGVLRDVKQDEFYGQIWGVTAYGYKPD